MSEFLSKEAILKADDLPKEIVEVPEWGGKVYVSTMTAFERDEWEKGLVQEKGGKLERNMDNLRTKLVVMTVKNAQGKRMFQEKDIKELSGKSSKAIDRLFDKAQQLNGIGQKDVEALTKN